MNFELWDLALKLASLLLSLCAMGYAFVSSRNKATNESIKETVHRVEKTDHHVALLDIRLTKVETIIEQLPQREDFARLHQKINPVAKDIEGLKVSQASMLREFEGVKRTLSTINEYLLNDAKRAER